MSAGGGGGFIDLKNSMFDKQTLGTFLKFVYQTLRSLGLCSDFRAFMFRLSCVRQTFVCSCSDFRAFFDVSRLCNFERTRPRCAFIFGLDKLASVWDLNLGLFLFFSFFFWKTNFLLSYHYVKQK